MASLEVTDAQGIRTVPLGADSLLVGRGKQCGVMLREQDAGTEHFELVPSGSGFRVVDLESAGGTRLNGRYVNQAELADGDVLQVGETKIVYRAGASAAAPAPAPVPAAAAAVAPAPRAAKSPSAGGRTAKRAAARPAPTRGTAGEPSDRSRVRRRQAKQGLSGAAVALIAVPALVVGALIVWKLIQPEDSVNRRIVARMLVLQDALDWDGMVRASEGADPEDAQEYARIMELKALGEQNALRQNDRSRIEEGLKAWQDVQLWRQKNFHADDEFVQRIDGFLAEFGDLGSPSVREAQGKRFELTGSAQPGKAMDADDAWRRLEETTTLFGRQGQFGRAFESIDTFMATWGQSRPDLANRTPVMKQALEKQAGEWFATQVSLARQNAEQGAFVKARKILQRAAERIGMDVYVDRANEELGKLRDMQRGSGASSGADEDQ